MKSCILISLVLLLLSYSVMSGAAFRAMVDGKEIAAFQIKLQTMTLRQLGEVSI